MISRRHQVCYKMSECRGSIPFWEISKKRINVINPPSAQFTSASNCLRFTSRLKFKRCRNFIFFFFFLFFSVVNQRYEPEVQSPGGFLNNNVLFRCSVPSFVKEHVSVTSWLQQPAFNIYPSIISGKFIKKKKKRCRHRF